MHGSSILAIVAFAALILFRRAKSMYRPIKGNGKMMIIGPMFMLTGFFGFLAPNLHFSSVEIISAIILGLLLYVPMIWTTNFEIREDGEIYTKKSKAFIFTLIILLVIRIALRNYIQGIDPTSLGMLFYLLAVFYVIPWRLSSYLKFRRMLKEKESFSLEKRIHLSRQEAVD